jgi:hypothetical protein
MPAQAASKRDSTTHMRDLADEIDYCWRYLEGLRQQNNVGFTAAEHIIAHSRLGKAYEQLSKAEEAYISAINQRRMNEQSHRELSNGCI